MKIIKENLHERRLSTNIVLLSPSSHENLITFSPIFSFLICNLLSSLFVVGKAFTANNFSNHFRSSEVEAKQFSLFRKKAFLILNF